MMDEILVFVFGAVIGSFLNVCIYRFPRKLSVVMPPSHCPNCKKNILWYDNIPVISYIFLKRRCRFCGARINGRYFIVEVLTGLVAVLLFIAFWPSPKFFAYLILTGALIVATFVDLDIQEIPDQVSIGGLIIALALSFIFPEILNASSRAGGLLNSFIGALAGGASIYLMGFFGELVFRKEAMGGGDVKLMAMIGAFLGWKLALFTFFIAPIFGSVVGVILRIKDGREIIPYGPHLSLAALISVFFGDRVLRIFLGGF